MSHNETQKLYRMVKDNPITLLSGGFHGFPKLNVESVKAALTQYPEFEDYLPNSRSVPVAFTKLKQEIRDLKVNGKTMVIIPMKPVDMLSWTWTKETLIDGFSLNVASAIAEGHDTAPDGCIGLSKDMTLVVSSSASLFLTAQNIDVQEKFQSFVAECGADEMRKAFNRFVQSLGTQAVKLKGGAILVLPQGQEKTQAYLKALRIAGVEDEFVATWNVMLDENNFGQLKNSIKLQTQSYLRDLNDRLESAKSRKNTLQQESTTVLEILGILDEYGIDDGMLGQLTSIDTMLKEQIAKCNNKVPTPRKNSGQKRQKHMTTIDCANCFATLVYKDRTSDLSAIKVSYQFDQNKIELIDASSKLQTISLENLTQILLCSVTPISPNTIVHTTYTIDPATSMVVVSKRSKTIGGGRATPIQDDIDDEDEIDDEDDEILDGDKVQTQANPSSNPASTQLETEPNPASTQLEPNTAPTQLETESTPTSTQLEPTSESTTSNTTASNEVFAALLEWIRNTLDNNKLPRLSTAQVLFTEDLVDLALSSKKVLLDSNALSIAGE